MLATRREFVLFPFELLELNHYFSLKWRRWKGGPLPDAINSIQQKEPEDECPKSPSWGEKFFSGSLGEGESLDSKFTLS